MAATRVRVVPVSASACLGFSNVTVIRPRPSRTPEGPCREVFKLPGFQLEAAAALRIGIDERVLQGGVLG